MSVAAKCCENEILSVLEPKGDVRATTGTNHGHRAIRVAREKKQIAILSQPTSSSSTTPRNDASDVRSAPPFSFMVEEDVLGAKLGWTRPPPGRQEKNTSPSIIEPKDIVRSEKHHPEPYHPPGFTTEVPSIGLTGCVLRYQ